MRAQEDLLGAVANVESRGHLQEVIRAYNAGAFKSAIVSLWVAVAVDLVAKIRQLADQGEPAAISHVVELDAAITGRDKSKLMSLERELLDRCRDEYEFIDARDHDTLTRLLEDRHICAHPAFVSPEVVFEPTAELVRAHLATAVDAVLQHGPAPGRKAIDRFTTEITGNAWPKSIADLREYLRERYFARGKEVLRRNLAQVIVKGCLAPPDDDVRVWKRLRKSALALDEIEPALLGDALSTVVGRAERDSGLQDIRIIRFIGALGELQPAWDVVPSTSAPRFATLIGETQFETLASWAVLSATTPIAQVEDAIEKRLAGASDSELSRIISVRPARKHVPHAMGRVAESEGWRIAEYRVENHLLPVAKFLSAGDIARLKAILTSNAQVSRASSMPPLLEQLYGATPQAPDVQAAWEDVVSDLEAHAPENDPNHYYAYPRLRELVRAASNT